MQRLTFLVILSICSFLLCLPTKAYANIVTNTSLELPIEKKKKLKKKKRKRRRLKSGKHPVFDKMQIIFPSLMVIGMCLFGFGFYLFPLWFIGLFLVWGSILGHLYMYKITPNLDGMEDYISIVICSFLLGISSIVFLVVGLLLSLPMLWMMGIIFLFGAAIFLLGVTGF